MENQQNEKDVVQNKDNNNNPPVLNNPNNLLSQNSQEQNQNTPEVFRFKRKVETPPPEDLEDKNAFVPRAYSEATTKIGHQVDTCCKRNEGRIHEEGDNVVICWKCSTYNLINKYWDYIECNACHALCKIPKKKNKDKTLSYMGYDIDKLTLGRMVAPRFTAIVCPFCKFENKVDVRAKELMCKACNSIWDIQKPDENPPEEVCDSVNPESHYYKFKPEFRKEPQYPPKYSVGISDMFFPDPVLYHEGAPYPVNPFADYALPYQEMLSFKRATKFMEHQNKIKRDLTRKYKVQKGDKKKFYKITNDLIKKIDKSIKRNNYMAYCSGNDDDKSEKIMTPNYNETNSIKSRLNKSTDKFLQNRNLEKNKLIENMFLMH